MKHANRKMIKSKNGSAVLEMALILPMLLMLVLGIVEFGRVFSIQEALTNSAREGARAGAVDLDNAGALATAKSTSEAYLEATGLDMSDVTVTTSFVTTGGAQALQVIVDDEYQSLITSWIPGVPSSFTLRSTSIMRRES